MVIFHRMKQRAKRLHPLAVDCGFVPVLNSLELKPLSSYTIFSSIVIGINFHHFHLPTFQHHHTHLPTYLYQLYINSYMNFIEFILRDLEFQVEDKRWWTSNIIPIFGIQERSFAGDKRRWNDSWKWRTPPYELRI